jgi:hypothetical protein
MSTLQTPHRNWVTQMAFLFVSTSYSKQGPCMKGMNAPITDGHLWVRGSALWIAPLRNRAFAPRVPEEPYRGDMTI